MTKVSKLIHIEVETAYIAEHSDETEPRFVFSYRITIENNSPHSVQLLSRYWLITDADGEESTVSGEGVVGKQPHINSNKHYQYSSGCVLKTPIGTMEGHYQFIDENGEQFQVEIPVFSLAIPNILH